MEASPNKSGDVPRGQIIAFVSAKGGSGKTLLTATAAYVLTRAGKRVLSIDTDFSTRGLSLYFLGKDRKLGKDPKGETRLEIKPENCLSDAYLAGLNPSSVRPTSIPRGDLKLDLLLS